MNTVIALFTPGSNRATTAFRYQYDYGQRLQFAGITLPNSYMVHFSNYVDNEAKKVLGDSTGVDIPDEYLATGLPVYAWVYLHTGEDDGETVYEVTIPVRKRSEPIDESPTPAQQSIIDQLETAVGELNTEVESLDGRLDDVEAKTTSYVKGLSTNGVLFSNDLVLYMATASNAQLVTGTGETYGAAGSLYRYYIEFTDLDTLMATSPSRPLIVGSVHSNSLYRADYPASFEFIGEPGAWEKMEVSFVCPKPTLSGSFAVDMIGRVQKASGG